MSDNEKTRLETLIAGLKDIRDNGDDIEREHIRADDLLLKYIDNAEVTELFGSIDKWYA